MIYNIKHEHLPNTFWSNAMYLPDTVAFPEMGLGVDTRDAALMAEGAVPLQVPMVAWLTHTCGCPGVLIIELTEEDTGADPSGCSATETKVECMQLGRQCNFHRAH